MRRYLKDNDKAHYIEEDIRFHANLADATGNVRLAKTLENVQNQIWIFRRKTYDLSSSTAADSHETIIRALEAGNRPRAASAMSEHITTVRNKLVEYLQSREPGERPQPLPPAAQKQPTTL